MIRPLLLTNFDKAQHISEIDKLIAKSEILYILVAFLKNTGLNSILKTLISSLKKGLRARFIIGIDFYITDPDALATLMKLSKKYDLQCFVVDQSNYTFHPKIYHFKGSFGARAIIGSANLTRGGLSENYEISLVIDDADRVVERGINFLLEELKGEMSLLDSNFVSAYKKKHNVSRAIDAMYKSRMNRFISDDTLSHFEILEARLEEMKRDPSWFGFAAQQKHRAKQHQKAKAALRKLTHSNVTNEIQFLSLFKTLIRSWTSTGTMRSSTKVLPGYRVIIETLKVVQSTTWDEPGLAFNYMVERLGKIKGFGINMITEILHTTDNEVFAVLNRNSRDGFVFASDFVFPSLLTRQTIDGQIYQKFCHEYIRIRDRLGLQNNGELDALFNCLYWERSQPS